jgi:NAD(P)-dependent dehydrogenase (short-subunit alcohol dehydrogenase family)
MTDKVTTVRSDGIFHALPTYPDSPGYQGLTAIVTGANGISGYHMVKVLAAAPERWAKIYCLSRRPPPDYFFKDLGESASGRVEHVEVDFLDTSGSIGKTLKAKIEKV